MSVILFGLKNCDSCRKALTWLREHDIKHHFHDLRQDGLDERTVDTWLQQCSWEVLLNRRSTSWRQLPEADKVQVDGSRARKLMLQQPTLVKRPVLATGNRLLVGFKAEQYADIFKVTPA